MGLTLITYLSRKSAEKAFMSALIGMLLSWVGLDLINGQSRFTFGMMELNDGIGVIPLVMGLFGISEVFMELETNERIEVIKTKIKNLLPNREDWRRCIGPILRSSILGFFLGIIPGGGGIIANFMAYIMEKRLSKHPERFGKGKSSGWLPPSRQTMLRLEGPLFPYCLWGFR